MSRAKFSKGVLLCLDNAEKWIEEADMLAQKGSYGHATALLVHGIEALAQAWICFTVARGSTNYDDKSVINYFKRHDVKLDFFTANLIIFETLKEFYSEHFTEKDFWNLNMLPLFNFLDGKKEAADEKSESYPKELMEIRNQGIYIDFNFDDLEFHTPKEITEKEYSKLKAECEVMWTIIFTLINNPLVKYR